MIAPKDHDRTPSERSVWVDRAYTCAVVTCGLFLMGLAIYRPSAGTIRTSMELEYTRLHDPARRPWNEVADSIRADATSGDSIRMLLAKLDSRNLPVLHRQRFGSLEAQIVESLDIEVKPSENPETALVSIQISGECETFQAELLTHLQHNFVERHDRPINAAALAEKAEVAKSQVAASLDELDAAQANLDTFVERRLAEERQKHEAAVAAFLRRSEQNVAGRAKAKMPKLAVVESFNPARQQLLDQLHELRSNRTRTSQVDEAKAMQEAIRELEAELNATPETVTSSNVPISNPYVSSEGEASTIAEIGPSTHAESNSSPPSSAAIQDIPRFDEFDVRLLIESETEHRLLLKRVAAAKSKHFTALDARKANPSPDTLLSEQARVTQRPRVIERKTTAVDAGQFLVVFLPSLLVGVACSLLRQTQEPPDAFLSPEDVEQWLDLPTIGRLSTEDGPEIPTPEPSQPTNAIRWVRRASEVIVGVAMVAVIVSAFTVPGYRQSLVADPFTAYTQACSEVTKLFH